MFRGLKYFQMFYQTHLQTESIPQDLRHFRVVGGWPLFILELQHIFKLSGKECGSCQGLEGVSIQWAQSFTLGKWKAESDDGDGYTTM